MINKYKNYKASGDQWLDRIPENWIVSSMKYHLEISGGYAFKSNDYIDKGGVAILRIGDIKPIVDSYYAKRVPYERIEGLEAFRAKENDILVAMTGATIGKNGVYKSNEEAYVNQRVGLLRSKNDLSQTFLKYFIDTDFFKEFIKLECSGSAQENISTTDIANLKIALPTVEEQTKIADYLDHQTGLIDAIIEKKQQLIEKLKEQRQAIINETVTKGLDPDASMKGSGVEWLGDIPEHWDIKPLKNVVTYNDETLKDSTPEDQKLIYVEIGGVSLEKGIEEFQTVTYKNSPSRARRIVRENDVIISTVRTYLKAIAKIGPEQDGFIVSTGFAVIRSRDIIPEYLSLLVQSENFIDEIIANSVGVSYPAINPSDLVQIKIPLPSKTEQLEISKKLENSVSQIFSLIIQIENSILKLKNYRQSIISEAVTGKIDVRNWEPQVKASV